MKMNTGLDFTVLKLTPGAGLVANPTKSTAPSRACHGFRDELILPSGSQSTAAHAALKPTNLDKVSASHQENSGIPRNGVMLSIAFIAAGLISSTATAICIGFACGVVGVALISPFIVLALALSSLPIVAVFRDYVAKRDNQRIPEG